MTLEDQVCSLELSKRLEELGVKQDSLFTWLKLDESHPLYQVHINTKSKRKLEALKLGCVIYGRDPYEKMCGEFIHYSAFTVGEIGKMLPIIVQVTDRYDCIFTGRLTIERLSEKWWVYYFNNLDRRIEFGDIKEADARAKTLIYLLENGLIKNDE